MAAAIRLSQQHSCPFNHLVRRGLQGARNGKAERLGTLQINDELKLRGLHDRQIARLSSFEDSSDVVAGLSIAVGDTRSIAKLGTVS